MPIPPEKSGGFLFFMDKYLPPDTYYLEKAGDIYGG
jgi:hypothetical protein